MEHKSLSSSSVSAHVRWLQLVGFCRLRRGRCHCPIKSALHHIYHIFALAVTTTYVLQQFIYAYQEKTDMDKLSQVMFIMLCHVTCVTKQIVFHKAADSIDDMIDGLDDPLYNPCERSHAALLEAARAGAVRLLRGYSGCAVATCVLWVVFPVVYRLQGQPFEFPFWVGIDYQHPLAFTLVLLYSFYCTNLVAIGNTTMDAFMATILLQCKTQLRILRMNFETLPERALVISERSKLNYEKVLWHLFFKCLVHYTNIIKTSQQLQDIFGIALLVQFGVGGWILCMAAYKIVSLDILSIQFASTTLFIICILTELFLYCYYGNEVTEESNCIMESIYSMEWLHAPVPFKRSLVVVMERAKRPLRPAAGLVIPLSLETFVKILKSSYSFYAVLRQTK